MARLKETGRDMPPRKRAKGIKINEDVVASKTKVTKLPTTGGKGKGRKKAPASPEASFDSGGIYATHLTISESEGEYQEHHAEISDPEDELLAAQRAELRSKRLNDPSRIRIPQTTSPTLAPAQAVVRATQLFTKPRGPYIPNWVREFYSAYGALVPQWKKLAAKFRPVDNVVVRGKKLLCDSTNINAMLECIDNITDAQQYRVNTKSLKSMKSWLAPLISDGTSRWLETGAPIKKNNIHVAGTYWLGFMSRAIMPS
uniref:Putative plant transposon protein domain-containing protein n=1 Tax=Solanum tuberosum TaxID=4113 RepID=M1DVN1_SOLTU